MQITRVYGALYVFIRPLARRFRVHSIQESPGQHVGDVLGMLLPVAGLHPVVGGLGLEAALDVPALEEAVHGDHRDQRGKAAGKPSLP